MSAVLALAAALVFLGVGAWAAALLDAVAAARVGGRPGWPDLGVPLRNAAATLVRQRTTTERPDAELAFMAPALYLALAATGLAVVPLAEGFAAIRLDTSIVLWGACESLVIVAVFLHGWSPNSPFPLIGAYRYVAIGLPVMLISMFVLIAAALPAQSLDLAQIVRSQSAVWNLVRQPLGLPLFLFMGLALTLRGPFDYADGADLAGGASAEDAGAGRAAWQFARLAMLASFSAFAASVFLGGYLGPVLPGPVWLILKSLAVMAAVVTLSHVVARMPVARMLHLIWTVLLPIAFVDLLWAGLEAL